MKAIVYEAYGSPDVLRLEEVQKPLPKDNEVLVKVHAASLNAADWHILIGKPYYLRLMGGLRKPRNHILGDDLAGRIEAVGRNVKQFQPGDEVFGVSSFGAFAEYRCVPEKRLAHKPSGVSFEQATTLPIAAITALKAVRDSGRLAAAGLQKKVLINGASGGVGTFAVQLARYYGAEVTAVCSTRNLQMVRSIGADHVVDYTKEDFTQSGRHYDLILGISGYHPLADYRRALSPQGIYISVGGTSAQYFQALLLGPLLSMTGSKKLGSIGLALPNQEDLAFLVELVETGEIVPVIDRCYPLNEVPEALRYFGEVHAQGKVVISVEQADKT
jgi:NADPH:quinone reductase-like Zn-dependent oxidoreductase